MHRGGRARSARREGARNQLRAGCDNEHDEHLAPGAEVEVAEIGGRARQNEIEGQQKPADRSRHANGVRGERGERGPRDEHAERKCAEDIVQAERGGCERCPGETDGDERQGKQPRELPGRDASIRDPSEHDERDDQAGGPADELRDLDEPEPLSASRASARTIQLSTSLTAAQLTAREPTAVPTRPCSSMIRASTGNAVIEIAAPTKRTKAVRPTVSPSTTSCRP